MFFMSLCFLIGMFSVGYLWVVRAVGITIANGFDVFGNICSAHGGGSALKHPVTAYKGGNLCPDALLDKRDVECTKRGAEVHIA